MKQLFRELLLAGSLTVVLCVGALAAEPTESGIHGIAGSGVTLTPQKADRTAVTADTQGSYANYYAGAVRFKAEAADLTAGSQYLLLVVEGTGAVPTADNIVYIDQAASDADGKVTFNAYPSSLTASTYSVYLVGNGKAFSAASPAATFSYYQAYTLGDVNDDEAIDTSDALLVLHYIVGNTQFSDTQKAAADVNNDTAIDTSDALQILHYIVGNITTFG